MKSLALTLKGESGVRYCFFCCFFFTCTKATWTKIPKRPSRGQMTASQFNRGNKDSFSWKNWKRKTAVEKKREASTLTCNPATPFFLVSDSSRSVNYWDTQNCLPPAPWPQSLLAALSEKRLLLQNFPTFVHTKPLFPVCFLVTLRHRNFPFFLNKKRSPLEERQSECLYHPLLLGQLFMSYQYSFKGGRRC